MKVATKFRETQYLETVPSGAFSFNALLRIFAIHTGRPSVKGFQAQFKVERVHLNTCESMHFQQQEDTSVLLCITVLNYHKIRRHLY